MRKLAVLLGTTPFLSGPPPSRPSSRSTRPHLKAGGRRAHRCEYSSSTSQRPVLLLRINTAPPRPSQRWGPSAARAALLAQRHEKEDDVPAAHARGEHPTAPAPPGDRRIIPKPAPSQEDSWGNLLLKKRQLEDAVSALPAMSETDKDASRYAPRTPPETVTDPFTVSATSQDT
ncbi:hypothetical protein DFH07DRAFT_952693 [Mycena maculata]|uniref:Uncharacterized protein n=1 Tax=Mycena maculata TaxID=230809 RepID=A0AAD7JX54_9AGAR|nr:hypothetical protein DFH07DRAFT_952693 [Mycena maculata]